MGKQGLHRPPLTRVACETEKSARSLTRNSTNPSPAPGLDTVLPKGIDENSPTSRVKRRPGNVESSSDLQTKETCLSAES